MPETPVPNSVLELTLIRHANTPWNTAGRWQGHSDIALSDLGIQQARSLGRRLSGMTFDAAYSSDLQRTQQTAHYALEHTAHPPLVLDARLREFNFGEFEGLTEAENRAHTGWAAWQADPWAAAVPGGESLNLLTERAVAWAGKLQGGQVVAFSHGLTIRALLWRLLGWPAVTPPAGWPSPFPMNVRLPHTSLTRLIRGPHGWELATMGDVAHLEAWSKAMMGDG